ncbi:MAG: hypothetical protein ABI743_12820, partial [bacterium]
SIDPVTIGEFVTYAIAPVHVEGVVVPVRNLLSIDISPDTRQIIAQGAGEAITFTAIGTFDMAPLTEDISTTVTWNSSYTDVMSFASNVGTGIGMGTTIITATQGAVTSADSCQVIVKPVLFNTVTGVPGYEVDAHQGTGEFYVATTFPHEIRVYNDQGVQQRSWPVTLLAWGPRGVTVDETTNHLYVGAYQPSEPWYVLVYDTTGNLVTSYNPASTADTWHFMGMCVLDNGQVWHAPFVPFNLYRYDPDNGTVLDTWANVPGMAAVWKMDQVANTLYIANVGYRYSGTGVMIADPSTHSVIASGATPLPAPAGYGQNNSLGVDRDGYIHVMWDQSGQPWGELTEVWEYTPPTTFNKLYEYTVPLPAQWLSGGGISRPNNVVCIHTVAGTGALSFFQ